MPRYDDRYGNTRLYVGHLSSRTRSRDLEDLFSRYGRVRDVDLKHDFAFVDFSDPRDADDARYSLNGREYDGSRIIVEFAKGPRGGSGGGSRGEYLGRGPPPGSGRCFNCGIDGHWARDCKDGDWKNKCYRCGERGHIERDCHNSPKLLRRGRNYSRSPSPRGGKGRGRSYSQSRSYSRSRSPAPRRERERIRSRSPRYSRSPRSKKSPPSKGRKHSLSPDGSRSSKEMVSPPPKELKQSEHNGSDYSGSPRREESRSPMNHKRREESRSPMNHERESSPPDNGRSPSPSPRVHANNGRSPRGSESPQV